MTKQSGNVLIFLMIAIFLLGGLAVVLTRTGNQSEDTGTSEASTIAATEVLRNSANIEMAVQKLISTGCSESQISFWYDSNGDTVENGSDTNYNTKSPTNRSCHIFYVEGAGVAFKDLSAKIAAGLQLRFGTVSSGIGRALKGIGEDNNTDLYVSIYGTYDQMNQFCTAVNKITGVQKVGGVPAGQFDPQSVVLAQLTSELYVGSFYPVTTLISSPATLIGKKAFCIGATTNTMFLYALYSR